MPVHIDEIVADVEAEHGDSHPGAAGAGGGDEGAWYCAQLQQARLSIERRERLRVD
jgi:hypothetical protein